MTERSETTTTKVARDVHQELRIEAIRRGEQLFELMDQILREWIRENIPTESGTRRKK